ncbi:MAG: phosphodiester glycosidase family protein, partial [Treponema sp.]|nr:phosphodiester glycosidase family protein [Treponema sp.]
SLFAGRLDGPPLEFWALRADLNEPGLSVVVNGPEPVNGVFRENHMPAGSVSHFTERYGCVAGINTSPFSPVSAKTGQDRFIDGIAVSRGVLVARPNPRFDALVFYADGGGETGEGSAALPARKKAAIVPQAELAAALQRGTGLSGIENAAGGFRIVLWNGAPTRRVLDQAAGGKAPRHPRSAAGLSAGGDILYLLAVDGRRPASAGVTEAELALILKQLGAYDGLNFDGGGSTSLALRSLRPERGKPYGRARPVNIPIHKRIPGWERAVASCLGIRLGGEQAAAHSSPEIR